MPGTFAVMWSARPIAIAVSTKEARRAAWMVRVINSIADELEMVEDCSKRPNALLTL